MNSTFLQNGDVSLRPLEVDDAEFLQQIIHSSEIRAGLGRTPEPQSLGQLRERIENQADDDSIIQFIIEKDGERAGTIALFHIHRDYRKAEFGAFMVDPEMQGEGVGTKALEALLEYAFDELNLHRVEGGYLEGNDASRNVWEKLGFQEEGRLREHVYRNGRYEDVIVYGLLEDQLER